MKHIMLCSLLLLVAAAGFVSPMPAHAQAHKQPSLKIIKDDLFARDDFYFVKGTIYNPNARAVKNVIVRYYIWKKWMGKEGHGFVIKDTGGLVEATIKYIPPKQSVEFTATGDHTAPVMTVASGLLPDPIDAEIVAEWGE